MEPIKLADRRELTTEEWLRARKQGIGGSDIAAILGFTKWGSPLTVYSDKVSDEIDESHSIAAEVGLELEPWLKRKFKEWMLEHEGVEVEVTEDPYIYAHPEHPFLIANLDGDAVHPTLGTGGFESKTAGERRREEWGEGEVPDAYYWQVQHYMAVKGYQWFYMAFLLGNRVFDVRFIPRNDEAIDILVTRAREFWTNFVEPRIPPAPTGLDADADILKSIYPEEEAGKEIDLAEMQADYDRYKALAQSYKDIKKDMDEIKQAFMAAMGDAEVAHVGEHKVYFKTKHRKEFVSKATQWRELTIK